MVQWGRRESLGKYWEGTELRGIAGRGSRQSGGNCVRVCSSRCWSELSERVRARVVVAVLVVLAVVAAVTRQLLLLVLRALLFISLSFRGRNQLTVRVNM